MTKKKESNDVVFVSYAHEDKEFVKRLCEALLVSPTRTINIDWDKDKLHSFESDWWMRVLEMIDEADTFLFIMTPDSVDSEYCVKEVNYAVSKQIRLAVVEHKKVEEDKWKAQLEAIGKPDWFHFYETDDFTEKCHEFIKAFDLDLDFVKELGRLRRKLDVWLKKDKRQGDLLRGEEIEDGLKLLGLAADGDKPEIPQDLKVFIDESLRHEHEEQEKIRARELAARAELVRIQESDRLPYSLLLAVESMRRNFSLLAQQILQQGLRLLSKPIITIPHNKAPHIALSEEGKIFATLEERYLRLWNEHGECLNAKMLDTSHELLALSQDGKYLATTAQDNVSIWEPADDGTFIEIIHIEEPATSAVFKNYKHCGLLTQEEWTVTSWEIDCEQRKYWEVTKISSANKLYLSPKGGYATDHYGGGWRIEDGNQVLEVQQPYRHWPAPPAHCHIHNIDISETKATVVSSIGWVKIYFLDHPERQPQTVEHGVEPVVDACFSPDGQYLVTAGEDNVAKIWNGTDFTPFNHLQHSAPVIKLAFSSDSRYLITSTKTAVYIWRISDGAEVGRLPYDNERLFKEVMFMPNSERVISSELEGVILWSLGGGEPIQDLDHGAAVGRLAFSMDSDRIATCNEGGGVVLWQWQPETKELGYFNFNRLPGDIEFSRDGRMLMATEPFGYRTYFWSADNVHDLGTGYEIGAIENVELIRATFSPDSRCVAGADMHSVTIWNLPELQLDTNTEPFRLTEPTREMSCRTEGEIMDIAFSPDGEYIAAASRDNFVYVWLANTGKLVLKLEHKCEVYSVTFDPKGRYLAAGCENGEIHLWTLAPKKKFKPGKIFCHEKGKYIYALAFTSDGAYLGSASKDKSARIWDMESGIEIARMMHPQTVLDLDFCPGEQGRLATACADGKVRIWRWQVTAQIDEIGRRLQRNLTESEWSEAFDSLPYHQTFSEDKLVR